MPLIDVLAAGVVNSSGAALSSGLVYVYQVGTTTKVTIYSDEDLTIPASNPLTLDSGGKAEVYVDQVVRLVIETSAGAAVDDLAEVGGDLSSSDLTDDIDAVETLALSALENEGGPKNLSISLNAGTLSVVGNDGLALSSANPGYMTMASVTAGRKVTLRVIVGGSMNDDAHASSDLASLGFGITEASHWASDAPFFIGIINRADTDIDGADGSSVFFITRNPAINTTPSSADNIGDTGAIPINDSQDVILIMDDVTVANYVSLPCQIIGAIRMQWSTTTDDWTVQTLGNSDGIGESQLEKTFGRTWTMPSGQNGATSGKYLADNGGTAPVFSTNNYIYRIRRDGVCEVNIGLTGDGGTDGASAVDIQCALPYAQKATGFTTVGSVSGFFSGPSDAKLAVFDIASASSLATMRVQSDVASALQDSLSIENNDVFTNGARNFVFSGYFIAF